MSSSIIKRLTYIKGMEEFEQLYIKQINMFTHQQQIALNTSKHCRTSSILKMHSLVGTCLHVWLYGHLNQRDLTASHQIT